MSTNQATSSAQQQDTGLPYYVEPHYATGPSPEVMAAYHSMLMQHNPGSLPCAGAAKVTTKP